MIKRAYETYFGKDKNGNFVFERHDIIRNIYHHININYKLIKKIIIKLMEGYDMTDIIKMYEDVSDGVRVIEEKDILKRFDNKTDYMTIFNIILKEYFNDIDINNKTKLSELCKNTNVKLIELYELITDNKECFINKQEFIDYSKIKILNKEEFKLLSTFLNNYKDDFSEFCYNNNVDSTWINLNHFYLSPCDVPRVLFSNFYKIVEENEYTNIASNILFDFILTYYSGEFHSRKMLDYILTNVGNNPVDIEKFIFSVNENYEDKLNILYEFEEIFERDVIEVLIEILESFNKSFDIDNLFGNYIYCYSNLNAFNENIVKEFEIYKNERGM